ncbi:hypothetical protein GCM10027290_29770 [Micromonospora sonneratiae]
MIDTYPGSSRANGNHLAPDNSPRNLSTEARPIRAVQPVEEQTDTQLEHAVRRATQMRMIFDVVVLSVTLTGQVTGETQKLDMPHV